MTRKPALARHLQVEQDQVVAVLLVQLAHLAGVGRRGDRRIAGILQHFLDSARGGLMVVDDQDLAAEDARRRNHRMDSAQLACSRL
jgi:hypothetical protein